MNYLDKKRFSAYWANTSSNSLVGKLICEGSPAIKEAMEDLLKGGKLYAEIDEQIIFSQLHHNENAISIRDRFGRTVREYNGFITQVSASTTALCWG